MIDYKHMYHLDDIVLSQFCPNTFKVGQTQKFQEFSKFLNSFHNDSSIYETSSTTYVAFIINSILLNSLELNKNLLSYENYFFNVLTGFSNATSFKISSSNIAKMWTNFLQIYEELLTLTMNEKVKSVDVLQRCHNTTRFIEADSVNNNYYWDIPIQINYVDGTIRNILFIPTYKDLNILSNSLVLNTINSYPSHKLSVIKIFMDSFKIELMNTSVDDVIIKFAKDYVQTNYTSFSKVNLHNCLICPIRPCSFTHMSRVIQPSTKKTVKKIKVINK